MADNTVTIEQLPLAVSLDGTEQLPIAVLQGGVYQTQRTTTGAVAAVGVNAEYVLVSANPLLPNARLLAGTSGQVTVSDGGAGQDITVGLAASGVDAGTYGDGTHVPQITVDADGRVTSASNVAITNEGTVTSVGLSAPTEFDVSGSPVTSSGTLALSWKNENANVVFAGPSSGAAGAPRFRALVGADLPASGVTAGSYGDGTHVAAITVDATGRVTAASQVAITHQGDVTSVGLSLPSDFTVSGSPVTSSGTLTGVWTTTPTGTGAMVRADSPALTGTPTAPTASVGTNTTQIATTAFVLANGGGVNVADRTALAALSTSKAVAWLEEAGRQGTFQWNSANLSTQVTADTQQGVYVPPTSDPTGASGAWVRNYTTLNQYMFGAVGDGVADDTVALQASINYVAASGSYAFSSTNTGPLLVWENGNHLISATITTSLNCDLSAATLSVHGLVLKIGVYVGSSVAGTSVFGIWCRLPRVINIDKPATGWTGVDDAFGIVISNLDTCQVFIPFVSGFGVNVLATAFSAGMAYNEIDLGILYNGKSNLRLQPSDDTGYVNENAWYAGRFTYNSAEGTGVSGVIDIEILESSPTQTAGLPDHNIFYKPSIESTIPQYNIYLQGTNNTFFEPRYEGPATVAIYSRTNEQSVNNTFSGGMTLDNVNFIYLFGAGATETRYNGVIDRSFMILEGSSNLSKARPTIQLSTVQSGGSVLRIFDATAESNLLTKVQSDTTYSVDISATALIGKLRSDAGARLKLDFQGGSIQLLNGAGTDGGTIAQIPGNGLSVSNNWNPATDIARNLGAFANRWLKGWFQNISLFPPASVTPANNGEMTFQLTSNTSLAIKVKGSDGTVRTGTITLS